MNRFSTQIIGRLAHARRVTQNVDRLHQRAGSTRVIELQEINLHRSALSERADEVAIGRAGVLVPELLEQAGRKMTIGVD